MELLLSAFRLGIGGGESYLLTVAEQLQSLGHEVTVHVMEGAPGRENRIRLVRGERGLPERCDAILAQDAVVSLNHARRYPDTPQVFVCHSDRFDSELPPRLPGIAHTAVVLNDRVEQRIRALAGERDVVRLTQPVDVARFAPRRVIREKARRVLVLSAYIEPDRQRLIDSVCADLGLECERIGFAGDVTAHPEIAMAHADIVVGKARAILEAMASGRAAYVWDLHGGDGWVTPESYARLEADNFGGRATADVIDADRLRADLAAYRPEMGLANHDLAMRHHHAGRHAERLVELLARRRPSGGAAGAPLREVERLTRAYRFADTRAFHLVRENDELSARLAEVDPGFVPGGARATTRLRWRHLSAASIRERVRWRAWRLRSLLRRG